MIPGKVSRELLDCLSYGISTIINNYGSNVELEENVVNRLDKTFTIYDLTNAIEFLYANPKERYNLGHNAKKMIKINIIQWFVLINFLMLLNRYIQKKCNLLGILIYFQRLIIKNLL